jgi:hypothetical protein
MYIRMCRFTGLKTRGFQFRYSWRREIWHASPWAQVKLRTPISKPSSAYLETPPEYFPGYVRSFNFWLVPVVHIEKLRLER